MFAKAGSLPFMRTVSAINSAPSRANTLGVADARLSSVAAVIFGVFAEAKTSAFAPCLTDVTSEDLPGEKLWGYTAAAVQFTLIT
jgi:hypothetical protein